MRFLFLIICFCLLGNSFAAGFVNGEGRFQAKEVDSLPFVKKQLLYNAFRDIFTKELEAMGLSSELFWRKLDSRFLEYFIPIDQNLKEKYLVGTAKETPERKKRYEIASRNKRLTLKSRFGKLSRAITSYSIQKMSRSTRIANSRYLSLQARVSRDVINKIFLDFTRDKTTRQFQNLFISASFELENMTWKDAGVELESDLSKVIVDHWTKWLQSKLGDLVSEVQGTDGEIEEQLKSYFRIPSQTTETLQKLEENEIETEKSETPIISPKELFKNSLWLRVQVRMTKKGENSLLKKRDFELSGEFTLIDLKNNSLAAYFDFNKEKKNYSYDDDHKLSSNLASFIYRLPMGEFNSFKDKISNLPAHIEEVQLKVGNIGSIQELLSLKKALSEKGVTYQFTPLISSYAKTSGSLTLKYQGDTEKVANLLLSLENEFIGDSKKVTFPSKENPYALILTEREKPLESQEGASEDTTEEEAKEESTNV